MQIKTYKNLLNCKQEGNAEHVIITCHIFFGIQYQSCLSFTILLSLAIHFIDNHRTNLKTNKLGYLHPTQGELSVKYLKI
ncbi:unnamed protein product, partial [Vitis vinifera]|uniref:Uncharacterized protein n=1 Tax=Vitis vinifera TaxID=29760 RepID=D7U414_VITVI